MFQTKFILFAVVALMAVSCADAIIGGQNAARAQFPYYAYIKTYRAKSDFWSLDAGYIRLECGGALVSNQYVLTSAQCLVDTDVARVHLGLTKLNDTKEDGSESFKVTNKDYLIYPTYNKKIPGINDIALVKLPSPVWFSKFLHTIPFACLPTAAHTDVITMGFGRMTDKKSAKIYAETLQYTKLQTVDIRECIMDTQYLISKNSVVCAKAKQSSICSGDLGGPLVSANSGKLIGIATRENAECKLGDPQGFTGVSSYIQWIEGVIEGVLCKK